MSIVVIPEEYLDGKLYCLQPRYGWRWSWLDNSTQSVDCTTLQDIGNFGVRIQFFFTEQKQLRGLVGCVEQPGHLFDGFWIGCTKTWGGEHNFTDRLCGRWDLNLGPLRPKGDTLPNMTRGTPRCHGYGVLTERKDDDNYLIWRA